MNIKRLLVTIVVIGIALLLFKGLPKLTSNFNKTTPAPQETEPMVVSTNPTTLDYAVIFPTQSVEITFNIPIENEGEFKHTLDPKTDYKIKLSDDRKTVSIIPVKPFTLSTTFTLFIKPDTKFDGKKTLGHDVYYHFQTIAYKGV